MFLIPVPVLAKAPRGVAIRRPAPARRIAARACPGYCTRCSVRDREGCFVGIEGGVREGARDERAGGDKAVYHAVKLAKTKAAANAVLVRRAFVDSRFTASRSMRLWSSASQSLATVLEAIDRLLVRPGRGADVAAELKAVQEQQVEGPKRAEDRRRKKSASETEGVPQSSFKRCAFGCGESATSRDLLAM